MAMSWRAAAVVCFPPTWSSAAARTRQALLQILLKCCNPIVHLRLYTSTGKSTCTIVSPPSAKHQWVGTNILHVRHLHKLSPEPPQHAHAHTHSQTQTHTHTYRNTERESHTYRHAHKSRERERERVREREKTEREREGEGGREARAHRYA
jgi:hypothetical protein